MPAHCANGQWSEIDRRDFRRDTTRCRGTRGLGGTAQPKHLALRRQRETLPWTHPAPRSPRFGRTRRYSTTRRPYRARQPRQPPPATGSVVDLTSPRTVSRRCHAGRGRRASIEHRASSSARPGRSRAAGEPRPAQARPAAPRGCSTAISRSWVAHAVDCAATRSSPSRRLTGSQCRGDVLADQSGPVGEQPGLGDRRGPPPLGQQPRQHLTEPLRVTLVGAWTRIPAAAGQVRLPERRPPRSSRPPGLPRDAWFEHRRALRARGHDRSGQLTGRLIHRLSTGSCG